ncbi:MAG: alkaline phosphatase [Alphaproteobacteria bacterium]|nr:alkaline phosphatase [Alphaproteobacteria bacterium]
MRKIGIAALLAASTLAMSGANAQDLPQSADPYFTNAQALIAEMAARQPNTGKAKNVILLIADGQGVGTNYAIRLFAGQQEGKLGEEHVLPYETAEYHSALVKTYNLNAQTPDSAPTAGSMNTGIKQRFNLINLGPNAFTEDCSTEEANKLTTFSEIVSEAGKSVGVVSTARLTHATPAAVYAKTAYRNWEAEAPEGCTDIAVQLIDAMEAGTIDVAMAGGARNFVPMNAETSFGGKSSRKDETDLIARATAFGTTFVTDKASLDAASGDKILGLFTNSDMAYEYDRTETEPSLADMTAAAIKALSTNENGFYLEVEAGRVDHANHAGNLYRALTDGLAFIDAVKIADELTNDEDTLIIVTADHEHAIAFNGYCGRGTPIEGLCMGISNEGLEHNGELETAADGKPYSVVGYLNGAGSVLTEQAGAYFGTRPIATQEEAIDPDYLQQALIPMSSESHSGEDVAVYAKGPWAHLFDGTIEQNYIFHVMNHAVAAN